MARRGQRVADRHDAVWLGHPALWQCGRRSLDGTQCRKGVLGQASGRPSLETHAHGHSGTSCSQGFTEHADSVTLTRNLECLLRAADLVLSLPGVALCSSLSDVFGRDQGAWQASPGW